MVRAEAILDVRYFSHAKSIVSREGAIDGNH